MRYETEGAGTSLAASRGGFLFGTVLVCVATFLWVILSVSRGVPEWTEYLSLAGILAQVLLIHRREQALYTSRRWRFWYALVLAVFACDLMTRHLWMKGHDTVADPMHVRRQLLVGGVILFYIMVSPVIIRLVIRNKKA